MVWSEPFQHEPGKWVHRDLEAALLVRCLQLPGHAAPTLGVPVYSAGHVSCPLLCPEQWTQGLDVTVSQQVKVGLRC